MKGFHKGQWVARRDESQPLFGIVRDVYTCDGDLLIDIIVYDLKGNKVGRKSPALDGPTGFEPACPAKNYRAIVKPSFPIERVGLYGNYDQCLQWL